MHSLFYQNGNHVWSSIKSIHAFYNFEKAPCTCERTEYDKTHPRYWLPWKQYKQRSNISEIRQSHADKC